MRLMSAMGTLVLVLAVLPGCCCPSHCSRGGYSPASQFVQDTQATYCVISEWAAWESMALRRSMANQARRFRQAVQCRINRLRSQQHYVNDLDPCCGFEKAEKPPYGAIPVSKSPPPNNLTRVWTENELPPRLQPRTRRSQSVSQVPNCAAPQLIPSQRAESMADPSVPLMPPPTLPADGELPMPSLPAALELPPAPVAPPPAPPAASLNKPTTPRTVSTAAAQAALPAAAQPQTPVVEPGPSLPLLIPATAAGSVSEAPSPNVIDDGWRPTDMQPVRLDLVTLPDQESSVE